MSAGRLNVSSGVFGPLFLIKQRRLIPIYTYIPLSPYFSRNSFICSLDRKKCPLVLRHFYLFCLVLPFLIFCVSHRKFVRCLKRYVSFFPRRVQEWHGHRQSETALAIDVNVNDDRTFSFCHEIWKRNSFYRMAIMFVFNYSLFSWKELCMNTYVFWEIYNCISQIYRLAMLCFTEIIIPNIPYYKTNKQEIIFFLNI